MNIDSLKTLINPDYNTLIICPSKYRNLLYQELLDENQILFNVSILSINSFLNNILNDNNIPFLDDTSIISQLKINQKLKDDNHSLTNNINYLSELEKLQKEFNLSNVKYLEEEGKYLNTQEFTFNNIIIPYDKIIIFSNGDFYPIHHELINSINSEIIYFYNHTQKPKYNFFEHNNIIRMLDYIIYDIYNDSNNEVLILCDDTFQKEYLISKFNELGIVFNTDLIKEDILIDQLTSFFSIIDNNYNEYDILNLKKLNIADDIESLLNYYKLDYPQYLKQIYDSLYNLNTFNTSFLNKLFSDLYQFKDINKSLFNKLLLHELKIQALSNIKYRNANVFIMSTDFIDFEFSKVYIADASLSQYKAKQVSYLLTTKQRHKISSKLINNQYYALKFKEKQEKLLHCSNELSIHYSLLNLDNKSQNLAHFVAKSFEKIVLEDKNNYYHLSIHQQLSDSLLIGNNIKQINQNSILKKFDKALTISASALDTFGKCPYQYFISYILKPFQHQELDSLTLGNLYHSIIEKINDFLITNQQNYTSINKDVLNDLIAQTINDASEKLISNTLLKPYYLTQFKKQIYATIQNFIDSNIFSEVYSKYHITASEQSLQTTIEHSLFNNVNIYGKIDALMSFEDYYYVLDYKSSSKDFSEMSFKNGLANQLITYLYLLKKNNYNITGAFFKTIKDNYVKSDNILDIDYNKQLHIDKNKMHGLLIENTKIEEFDNSLLSEGKSAISNVTTRKIISIEKLIEYFTVLEQHFERFLDYLENGTFTLTPFMKSNCDYCQYKVICKEDNPMFRKEEKE